MAADGELGRRGRHDRALDRRARDARRRARRPSAARDLPRLVPPLASGYDVTDPARVDALVARGRRAIGLDRLRALHVNDSATPLGSNRDRHANILEGLMGEGLGAFLAHPAFQHLAAYLEMPGDDKQGPNAERDQQAARAARALDRAERTATRQPTFRRL